MTPLERLIKWNTEKNHRVFYPDYCGFILEDLDKLAAEGYLRKEGRVICIEGHCVWAGLFEACADHVNDNCQHCELGEDRYELDDPYNIESLFILTKDFPKDPSKNLDVPTLEFIRNEMKRDLERYKALGYVEVFLDGYSYFLVHLEAGIERIKCGEGFNPTSQLADM